MMNYSTVSGRTPYPQEFKLLAHRPFGDALTSHREYERFWLSEEVVIENRAIGSVNVFVGLRVLRKSLKNLEKGELVPKGVQNKLLDLVVNTLGLMLVKVDICEDSKGSLPFTRK